MNCRRSLFLILCLALVPNLFAAQRPPTDQELLARYTPVEIADYRESIRQTFILGHELLGAAKNPVAQKLVEQRMQMLDKLSDANVARLKSYGADFNQMYEAMLSLRQIVNPPVESENRKPIPLSAGFPAAEYSFCGSAHRGAEGLVAAEVLLNVGKGLFSLANRGCDQVLVALGEGGNTSLFCIVADTALVLAQAIFDGVTFCEDDIDSAEINGSYRRLAHIHDDLTNLQSSSDSSQNTIVTNQNNNTSAIETHDDTNAAAIMANDNANKTAIINADSANAAAIMANDNANKAAIIAVDNANEAAIVANDNTNRVLIINEDDANRDRIIANDNANRDMIIADAHRLAIEQSLATNVGTPVALFELQPQIDVARSIVRQTIDNMKAAGQNVFQAETFYAQALTSLAAGAFKDAFHLLQKSYQEAAK